MKVTQLRIGNYVNPKYPFKIDGSLLALYYNREKYLGNNNIPDFIPLTEKWILKFNLNPMGFYIGGYEFLPFGNNCYVGELVSDYGNVDHEIKLEYVHQLQNTYFTFYGKEL